MIDGVHVIDFHGHVGRWDRYGMIDEPAKILHALDLAGIDQACLFNIFHPMARRPTIWRRALLPNTRPGSWALPMSRRSCQSA